jgi:hypothetical protein
MGTAGYSGTPLEKKLGLKSGFTIKLVNPPKYYHALFTSFPQDVKIDNHTTSKKDFIHFFPKNAAVLYKKLPELKEELLPAGVIWVSWYKKSSGIDTDINENAIRNCAIANGLVDVKVCAVSDLWSGLKLVIPVKLRVR